MNEPRYHSNLLPFSWTGTDLLDELQYQYYDVVFTRDFGQFKTGDQRPYLAVNFDEGQFEEIDDNGKVSKVHEFSLQAKEDSNG